MARACLLLLALTACRQDYKVVQAPDEPLSLTILTPRYGEYVDADAVELTGVVSPPSAQVLVGGATVPVAEDGSFAVTVPFAGQRALAVHVEAIDPDEHLHEVVAAFDGVDPRLSDPGAVTGLLTPSGLDAMEPLIAETVDSLGWTDQILAALPAVESDWVDLIPVSVTADPTTADLAPGMTALDLSVTLNQVAITSTVNLLDYLEFDVEVVIGTVTVGAAATPAVDEDGMLTLTLSDAVVEVNDWDFTVSGFDLDWVGDYLIEPLTDLVLGFGDLLLDFLLDGLGTLELGGPFAFETDLMGTEVAARLVTVEPSMDGVGLGATVSTDGDAANVMPELAPLVATTPSGLDYQLGLGVHEGLLNTVVDASIGELLDLDLTLTGEYADLLGGGIRALPGGTQMPPDTDGYCIGLHAGDARVLRFDAGQGRPLARVWMPDLRFSIETQSGGVCSPWLDASVFAILELNLSGTEVSAELEVPSVIVLHYGAEDVDEAEVGAALGQLVESMVGLFAGTLSFDLGDALGALPVEIDPRVVSVEPLDDTGRVGIYLDLFPASAE